MRILVSMCLLGVNCRYNGIAKEDRAVCELLQKEELTLVPVCPEQLGGLPTPRTPSECLGERVISIDGEERTAQFGQGATEVLRIARMWNCEAALLKERSPSCGSGERYDGSFSGKRIVGDGVTTKLLRKNNIPVFGESELDKLLEYVQKKGCESATIL